MTGLLLLAQTPYENRLQGLRGAFDQRKTDPTDVTGFLVFFGCVIAIAAIWTVARRLSNRNSSETENNNPIRLFDAVTGAMGIGFRDRLVLRLFARHVKMPNPSLVFFDEKIFDQQAEQWIEGLGFAPLKQKAGVVIGVLRDRAFPDAAQSGGDAAESTDPLA